MPATKGRPDEPTDQPTTPAPASAGTAASDASVDKHQRGIDARARAAEEKTKKSTEKARAKEQKKAQKETGIIEPSPRWWAPLMVTLMIIGLLWVVLFYVSQAALPVKSIGNWNILVGFAFMLVGFAMTTRWR